MGDGQGQGVCGIRTRKSGQFEHAHDHLLHLGLAGSAVASHSLFKLQGGVLVYRQILAHQCRQARAPGLSEQ
jgi:hypothetical protein